MICRGKNGPSQTVQGPGPKTLNQNLFWGEPPLFARQVLNEK